MATDARRRPQVKAVQMSRRALFQFLQNRGPDAPQRDGEDVIATAWGPLSVPCDALQSHGIQQIDDLLARLERRAEDSGPATRTSTATSESKQTLSRTEA